MAASPDLTALSPFQLSAGVFQVRVGHHGNQKTQFVFLCCVTMGNFSFDFSVSLIYTQQGSSMGRALSMEALGTGSVTAFLALITKGSKRGIN